MEIEGLFENDTGRLVKPAPLYDHNISMLCYAHDRDMVNYNTLQQYYRNVNFGPKLYNDFISVAKALMTPDIRKRLINMKGIKLTKHNRYNLPDWRIDRLNKIVNNQIMSLLSGL